MNIIILFITVILMRTVPTPKDHSTALVSMVIPVMGSSVLVSSPQRTKDELDSNRSELIISLFIPKD